jgi:CBS domain-containing protein
LQIKEVMNRSVASIQSRATLLQAAEQLRRPEADALLVLDGERPRGVLTERDITREVLQYDGDRDAARRVLDIVDPRMAGCYEDVEVEKVRQFTEKNGFRRLVVFNRNKEVVGVAHRDDLDRAEANGAR